MVGVLVPTGTETLLLRRQEPGEAIRMISFGCSLEAASWQDSILAGHSTLDIVVYGLTGSVRTNHASMPFIGGSDVGMAVYSGELRQNYYVQYEYLIADDEVYLEIIYSVPAAVGVGFYAVFDVVSISTERELLELKNK